MKRSFLILLPALFVALAVGVIVYQDKNTAEGISVDSANAAGNAYSVPDDIYYTKSVESVVFSHNVHVAELGFKCDSCHTGLFQMKAKTVEGKPDFSMQGLAAGKYCGSCHNSSGQGAFSSTDQCARCHQGVKGLAEVEGSDTSPEGSAQDQYQDSAQDQYQRGG